MKNRNKRDRHELKKEREFRNTVLGTVLVIAVLWGLYNYFLAKYEHPVQPAEQEIESYIRSMATEKQVSPGREPVILHYWHPGMTNEEFCCVGTVYIDREYGMSLMTAEHVFRTDVIVMQKISFRPLRKGVIVPTYYLEKIVKTSKDLGGLDAVVATFGTNEVLIPPFSKYVYSEIAQNFYGEVDIRGKKITELRSLVSGQTVKTVGYSRRGEGTNGAMFIMIEYRCRRGESGTGYVDDRGGMYVLHAAPDPEDEKTMLDEYRTIMHTNISSLSTVSGPFGGNYE